MPQILMLNHAAYVNKTRSDIKSKTSIPQHNEGETPKVDDGDIVFNGKPFSELTSEEMVAYMND